MNDNAASTLIGSNPSNPYVSVAPAQFMSLEEMNKEAQAMLNAKQEELTQYQNVVADAERILSKLNAEIEEKTAILQNLQNQQRSDEEEYEQQQAEQQLALLQQKHEEEINKIKQQHEDEMHNLQSDFQQTLTEAENWANRHSQIALQEKMEELEALRREAESTKRQLDEVTFMTTRTQASRESENDQKKNAQEISALENQISELTSITREELRDSRAKIDETLAAIELRRVSHEAELKRLDEEIAQRKECYDQHIEAIKQQYANERQTVEQSIASANAKAENTENIIKQLENHHEAQLKQVLDDIETMRRSTGMAGSRPKQSIDEIKSTVRENQKIADECRALDEEIRMVEEEIKSLEDENRDLKQELLRYAAAVQRMNK